MGNARQGGEAPLDWAAVFSKFWFCGFSLHASRAYLEAARVNTELQHWLDSLVRRINNGKSRGHISVSMFFFLSLVALNFLVLY